MTIRRSCSAACRALGIVLAAAVLTTGCARSAPTRSVDGVASNAPTPEEDQLYIALIRGMNERGQSQAALAFLDDYLGRHPGDVEALSLKGEALLRTGQTDEADQIYIQLDRRRIQPVAAFGLGQVRAKVGDWKGAVPQYARAAKAAPTDSRVLNNYGFALMKIEDYAEAYDVLARASQLSPESTQIRTNFAIAAMKSGREAEVPKILARIPEEERGATLSFVRSWQP
ncbi:tetratricopeptide repeat protein [Zavarzinia compransoris]|uniref:tetratricopeptide repeat protein n=1 Tax=Zavarzinia marina TaxID=2911065 RepID=UPI001F18B09A|nr:tetratricopeptide repeat protein [Zavarzinia marina]MCF4166123.1 tetratricopeptide repeat protein [Zavarzinia marina]